MPLTGAVVVRSLLPADTAQRDPKPLRALFDLTPFPWWIVALIAAIVALLLVLWWWLVAVERRRPA